MSEWAAELIRRYIIGGETPALTHHWEVETPETYVARLYAEAGAPAELRRELIGVLKDAAREDGREVLGRALQLAALIPHLDFAAPLQEIFFKVRVTGLKTQYGDAALQALRVMQAIQLELPDESEERAAWKTMWLYLVDDPRHGKAAFLGLRDLDPMLALSNLHLLLRRDDLQDTKLDVFLRGLRRDAEKAKAKDPDAPRDKKGRPILVEELSSAILKLTAEKFIAYEPLLREVFGENFEQADEEACRKLLIEIAQESLLLKAEEETSLRSLREKLFPPLAVWLKEQTPVAGVSIWLVDRREKQVHFMAQAGCPGKEPTPPRILNFGEGASGEVAEKGWNEFFNLDDARSPVYLRDKFLKLEIHGLYSVIEKAEALSNPARKPDGAREGDAEPSFELVINFFDSSLDRLRLIKAACLRSARTAVYLSQNLLDIYTKRWVAHLTDNLSGKPTLTEVVNTLLGDITRALHCDRAAIYLFRPEVRRLFLYATRAGEQGGDDGEPAVDADKLSVSFKLGEGLSGVTAAETQAVRLPDARDRAALARLRVGTEPDFYRLGLNTPGEHEWLNYLGVSLRDPAPASFRGRLVGAVEMYRREERDRARVFTPLGEHVFMKLAEAATPRLSKAFQEERRYQTPIEFPVEARLDELKRAGYVATVKERAERAFLQDVETLLSGWAIVKRSSRHFYAFRSDLISYGSRRVHCKAFWPKSRPDFGDEEKLARSELKQAILARVDSPLWGESAVTLNAERLAELNVPPDHRERILRLGLTLIPLVERGRLTGIVGLEFDSEEEALDASNRIRRDEPTTQFVSTMMLGIWSDRMKFFQTLYGTLVSYISEKAVRDKRVESWQSFFDYLAVNPAASSSQSDSPRELSRDELFIELTRKALRRFEPVGADCGLNEEGEKWLAFTQHARQDGLRNNIGQDIKVMAVKSALRMVLATSTAVVLWGGTAELSLDENREDQGWSRLRISVPTNGNGTSVIRKQGLDLAKGISELNGWPCDEDGDGLVLTLPHFKDVV